MDITAFIRELLFGHDCVIVPGFGGFIGNYSPAHIERNSGTFYPPVKQISFNRNLNHNDGLLIGKISGSLLMSYGDAKARVGEFVDELRRKLDRGEKVVFDNIGSFVLNQEGNIQFEPDRNVNYHLDSYGLESFQCLPLEGYDLRKRIVPHTGRDPVKMASLRKTLWRAAVVIPLLTVLVAVPLRLDKIRNRVESSTLNPLASAELEHNRKVIDQDAAKKQDTFSTPEVKPDQTTPVEPATPAPPVKEAANFFLITGSFKSESNAKVQADQLQAAGFTPEIISSSNGFFRVCARSFGDLNSALKTKDSIAAKFPSAWVSKNR